MYLYVRTNKFSQKVARILVGFLEFKQFIYCVNFWEYKNAFYRDYSFKNSFCKTPSRLPTTQKRSTTIKPKYCRLALNTISK